MRDKDKSKGRTKTDEIQLRDPYIACWLAWLVPGLGHLYQGRKAKALVYAVCILGLFFFGAALSSGKCGLARCVYVAMRNSPGADRDMRYYYLAQVWVGVPAFPALIQYFHDPDGEDPLWNGLMAPPLKVTPGRPIYSENDNSIDNIRKKLNRRFEVGTLMTAMAGLLNLFAIFDALYGPVNEEQEEQERQRRLEEKRLRRKAKRRKGDDFAEV
ncbi:MAG: hypothetical protein E7028_01475 [Planctomycetaceae bacterium]|nr:hypothetical protein [Planctomycetaceae bacterium]